MLENKLEKRVFKNKMLEHKKYELNLAFDIRKQLNF